MSGGILFLAHRVPYPPDRGDKIRSFHILKRLTELAPVHLATFADDETDLVNAESLRPLVGRMHVERRMRATSHSALAALAKGRPVSVEAFASRSMQGAVAAFLREESIATVFAFSGQMAQFVPAGPHRFVMDFVDVDSAKFAAYAGSARWPLSQIHAREGRLLAAYEQAVAARADLNLFVSDAEAGIFRGAAGLQAQKTVATLENGIDLVHYAPTASFSPVTADERGGGPLIVFTGQMDYRPNVAAALDFAATALPRIRSVHPGVCFAVVGRNPVPALRRLHGEGGVHVTGAVADVRGWLAGADIVVAPLGIARGIQNKVLEGMAMARPVVASPAAFEGIDAVPGRDLIVDDVGNMASAILDLLRSPARRAEIGAAARSLVERRYGWQAQLSGLAGIVGIQDLARPSGAAA